MKYIWNEEKNIKNFHKHGVWFEEACTVFADKNALEIFDETHSDEEDRYILLGLSSMAKLLVVVHCEWTDTTIRLISARKATKKERRDYEKRI